MSVWKHPMLREAEEILLQTAPALRHHRLCDVMGIGVFVFPSPCWAGWDPPAPVAAAGAVPGACMCLFRGGFLTLCHCMDGNLHPAQQEPCLVCSSAVTALFRLCSITVCAWLVRGCPESTLRLTQPCLHHTNPTLGWAQRCGMLLGQVVLSAEPPLLSLSPFEAGS